ncbi:1,6-dihydroxycyclohexa-2,4-diene-1-carboxylate dehydrogenase [Janibacter terrae]|uniref:1,6-dihydroxycyclohexa-2,4-diene-1-carboxylate dehydrogenase n=1 Tax=Janibacter terrae TaxID=103817 RepID=A0ABZ2FD38_9MICO|nr:1,6-dihydroxycyclohexa-2,4-diene-1-carboxylate dehydrogenase [Janibacter terrae]MBA4084086.1 1,6-dihydroxycyclohexa-2,4-diene-1-carboxylate dehydrogenase [Kytococcus sp.]HBO55301.1 1,6-dihydroxycyclohexa-2,4-diene-1-carboxylate dehydrogenase [Janibacter terrae]
MSPTCPDRFAGKVVVVTGSAQGIGAQVAERAAAEGGSVLLVDRSPLVAEVVERIVAADGIASCLETDLEQWSGAEELRATAVERYGRIDVLVNNVGGTIWTRPYEEYEPEHIQREISRSLFPTLWCCRAVLPSMVERGSGVIVNVSSIATRSINRVPYAAAKGGVNALTASLSFEAASKGVRVVATAPGGTEAPARRVPRNDTELGARDDEWYQQIVDQTVDSTHVGRYGTLAEQAAPILFLASDEASYITGSVLPVGGGDQG